MTTETDKLRCADCGASDGWLNDVTQNSGEPALCNACRRARRTHR